MKARRILITTDAVGGVWTYSIELAAALRRMGVEAVLAAMGPQPSARHLAMAGSTPVIDTGLPLDWLAASADEVRRAGRAIAQLGDDVHADVVQLHSASLACGVDFNHPVVAVQHSCIASWWDSVRGRPLPAGFAWRRDCVDCGLDKVDAVVTPTAAFATQTAQAYAPSTPVQVVHNGRTPFAVPARERPDAILTVGRLWDEGKNVRTLDAAARLTAAPVEAIGPLNGPNGTAVKFDDLLTPGCLEDWEIARRLASQPIFVSTALYEPFGLSVLEAAQAGCPLVLSDIPTFRELWNDAAVFVPATDPARLADAFASLLNNPELRNAYGRAARRRAGQYTPEATAGGMLKIYDSLAASAPLEMAGAA